MSARRILIKRTGALGDVIDVTPVTRRLRVENPGAEIDVETQYPQVFRDSPDRIGVKRDLAYDRVIDLDMTFERNLRRVGIVESYMEAAFGDRRGSTQLVMAYGSPPDLGVDWSKTVTMHAARSWVQRTLPWSFWTELAAELVCRGFTVVATGTAQDWPAAGMNVVAAIGKLDLQQQAAVIGASRAFVCSESGPMMLAQVTDVPVVALHTMALPWMTKRERHGEVGWRFHPIIAPIDCAGCSHRMNEPTTFFRCPRGDNACVSLFDPKAVADQVEAAAQATA